MVSTTRARDNQTKHGMIAVSRAITRRHATALLIVLVALVLRLTFVLVLDPSPDFSGGDTGWYMDYGRDLVSTGKTDGPMPTAPLYPTFVGIVQLLVRGNPADGAYFISAEIQMIRIIQSIVGALFCLAVYALAYRLFSQRTGWLAAAVLAISPTMIIEVGTVYTEGLFLFFVYSGLALYAYTPDHMTRRWLVIVGIVFGLATLTRAVFLLFPLGIALHLFVTQRSRWKSLVLALLVSYGALISTWTIYNAIVWNRLVIGADGIVGAVYQGAAGKASPQEIDQELDVSPENDHEERSDAMKERIADSILGDPLNWLGHRAKELLKAYVQPHNTIYFGGESIRDAASDWARHDRTPRGLIDVTRIEAFWPKLVLYLFHFGGLALGVGGMVTKRERWRALLPLYGLIVYFTGIHMVLLALPRYIFPLYPAFWLFGAAWLITQWNRRRASRVSNQDTLFSIL